MDLSLRKTIWHGIFLPNLHLLAKFLLCSVPMLVVLLGCLLRLEEVLSLYIVNVRYQRFCLTTHVSCKLFFFQLWMGDIYPSLLISSSMLSCNANLIQGSTCAFCEAILRECGFRTGLFTSPHLIDVRERFRVNGWEITCMTSDEIYTPTWNYCRRHLLKAFLWYWSV